MVNRKLYLHIGPPKTATTFLQDDVLPGVSSADWVVKPTVQIGSEPIRFGDLFLRSPEIWRAVGSEILAALGSGGQLDLIVSDEHIMGGVASPSPWIPGWFGEGVRRYGSATRVYRQTNILPSPSDVGNHLEVLSEVARDSGFSETKVTFTLRRQDSKLASSYAQLSNRIRGASQEHFEDWCRHLTHHPIGYYMAGGVKLDYLLWWENLLEVLEDHQVFCLPFERLREETTEYLHHWLSFLDISEADRIVQTVLQSNEQTRNARSEAHNRWTIRDPMQFGPKLGVGPLLQRVGLSTNYSVQWLDFFRDDEIIMTPDLRAEILDVYRDSNRKLDALFPHVSLGRFGYY